MNLPQVLPEVSQLLKEGDTKIFNVDQERGENVSNTVALEERTIDIDEGQVRSDSGNTLESRHLPDEYQAGSNLRPSHVALARPNLESMHEDFISRVYPKVHESLKHTTKEHVFLESPPSLSRTLSSMKNLNDAFTYVLINFIIESRDAIFDENNFSLVSRPNLRIPNRTKDISGLVVPEEDVALKEAINDEMDSIIGNNTWVMVDLPPGCKPFHCKWIFNRKMKVDGTIEKFKARLAIQSFKQKSGIDYFHTYALVVRISTIRLLKAMTSIQNLTIDQMDVKTAFLNGEVEEEEFLSSRFSMKDMREADVIFSIRIKHKSNGIAISQSHHIEKVLNKFNYFDCTPVSTRMDSSEKLMPNNGQVVSQLKYSRVIGCLMYAMTSTRPDIAFNVGKLSRYTSNPVLEGYTDASWISNTDDNSPTSD
nr:zinc finger, CCHC-type [Tanacetum cinerariifolium]